MESTAGTRLRGLDTLRALAIVAVMFYHLGGYFPQAIQPATRLGWAGVDLFFVLSGYLIGKQLLRPIRDGRPLSLIAFYRNRAYRILPAFLITLLLYLWPATREGNGFAPVWQYVTFTANLLVRDYPDHNTFSHVWSLCVEEHFYLLLPLLALLLGQRRSTKLTGAVMTGVLLFGIAVRSWFLLHAVQQAEPDALYVPYMGYIYYPTWSRMDGLLTGVGLALLELFRPLRWQTLARWSNGLAACGAILLSAMLWLFRTRFTSAHGASAVSTVIGYPLLSMALGCLVASAVMPGSWLARLPVPGSRTLALMAFSLYLTHKQAAHVLYQWWPRLIDAHPAWAMLIILPACVAVGGLLYVAVERPFLRLRDCHTRSNPTIETQARLDPAL